MRDLRRDYGSRQLDEAAMDADPLTEFRTWFDEAVRADIVDPNAMSLATASRTGEPSVRTVLLRGVDERGFVFFTHYDSPKSRALAGNPRAALLFFWPELERQVRISGPVTRVSREESETYFASRPRDSQWAAWAAVQSSPLPDRQTLERLWTEVKERFANDPVPCPPDWGGYLVAPQQIEFWQGRPGRLHDRIAYVRQADDSWTRTRLAP